MNTQIYLMLVRKINPKLPLPVKIPMMLKNFIGGDSLDAPFFKFIKVQSVAHSIGFEGENKVTVANPAGAGNPAITYRNDEKQSSGYNAGADERWGDKSAYTWKDNWKHTTGWRTFDRNATHSVRAANAMRSGVVPWMSSVVRKGNNFTNIHLPDHNEFEFTKYVDNATPQLAYGCSAQEPFYFAGFFFRRRIGAGIEGVRMPYMGIGLTNVLIEGWSLADDVETVKLSYKKIMWGTFDQVADINAPTGMSYRVWETDEKTGGETLGGLLIQGLIAGLTVAGAAAATAIVGGFGDEVSNG